MGAGFLATLTLTWSDFGPTKSVPESNQVNTLTESDWKRETTNPASRGGGGPQPNRFQDLHDSPYQIYQQREEEVGPPLLFRTWHIFINGITVGVYLKQYDIVRGHIS